MFLTTRARYAIIAMIDIASNVDAGGGRSTVSKISTRQSISVAYLEQLFVHLRNANLVLSSRGPGGGYMLARPADQIKLSEIVESVGENIKMTRCDIGRTCQASNTKCLTHNLLESLGAHIYTFFDSKTLQDAIVFTNIAQ